MRHLKRQCPPDRYEFSKANEIALIKITVMSLFFR